MIQAKLFILGLEIELLWTDMHYYRQIRINGKPATEIMGGLITVCFATNYYTDLILRWMTKESEDETWEEVDKMEKGKVCFYENGFDYPPTKTYEFNDALLIFFKEIFKAKGEEPNANHYYHFSCSSKLWYRFYKTLECELDSAKR